MFGKNEIHGRKTFEGHDDLLVTSIFYTIQGEGPFAGRPAVFLRLTHCNLACDFCDTSFSHGEWLTRGEVIAAFQTCVERSEHAKELVLVVTGGEPTLQANALHTLLLISALNFDEVQIESNGILPTNLPGSTYLVISPKCHHPMGQYIKPHKDMLTRAGCLKFVVTSDESSTYHTLPPWAFEWMAKNKRPIYISPMAEYKRLPDLAHLSTGDLAQRSAAERISFWECELLDFTKVRANHEYAARYAMQHGLRLSMQMQLFTSLA